MTKNTKFYVIETVYDGPDEENHADDRKVVISTEPARTNMSHEILLEGWCGSTNKYSTYAHGEFDTIEEAREAVENMFDGVRDMDTHDSHCVEAYKAGQYEQLSKAASVNYMYESMTDDIKADTTDEDIEELLDEYDGYAESDGYTLDRDAVGQAMIEMRDEKIAKEA